MRTRALQLIVTALAAVLAGCAAHTSAPVIDRLPAPASRAAVKPSAPTPRVVDPTAETYTVKAGDTLYSIALEHGQNYRDVAQWNGINDPSVIRVGQVLRLRPPPEAGVQVNPIASTGRVEARPLAAQPLAQPKPMPSTPPTASATQSVVKTEPRGVKLPYSDENFALLSRDPQSMAAAPAKPTLEPKPTSAETKPLAQAKPEPKPEAKPEPKPVAPQQAKPVTDEADAVDWGWPTAGRVMAGFSESTNKGLDIAGKSGQPVLASASGTVIYVGSGIRGYGKLIVIRHNKAYSSVYAHNDAILVKEGQRVVKGEQIAEMGNSDANAVKLHFEIRRLGKPVDPSGLLPQR